MSSFVHYFSQQWIHIGVTVRKRPIRVKVGDFLSRMTFKFDEWPWKTIGHLFYATSSFLHHFTPFSEFKLKLQSGKPNCGQNRRFFVSCDREILRMISKTIGQPFYATSSFLHQFVAICKFQSGSAVRKCSNWSKICFDLCDLEHWPLTLIFCKDITFVNGNKSWKFHDDAVSGQADKQTIRCICKQLLLWKYDHSNFSDVHIF